MQMNSLQSTFGDAFVVLGFPCNQHGHQTQESDQEVLNLLKYVRPGNGYEPNFPMFSKLCVNGADEDELFTYLKAALPTVHDDKGGAGADHISDNSNGQPILWTPIRRSDITWNFEKFIINQEGVPVRRYSPKFPTENCAADIKALIEKGPNALN
jgi:glutathione peroxidase